MQCALGSGNGQRQRSPGEHDRKPTVPYPRSGRDTKVQLVRTQKERKEQALRACHTVHPTARGMSGKGKVQTATVPLQPSPHACPGEQILGVQFQVTDEEELPRKVHTQSLICKLDTLDD